MRALGISHYLKHILFVFLLYLAQTFSGNERDHLALLDFKSKISHDPQGAFSSWNSSLEICNWEGIICSHRHRRVTTLDLSSKGLVGTLSPYIGNLSFLHQIILSNNTLHGVIPQELGRLSRLQVLDLTRNNLGSGEHRDLNFLRSLTNCTTLKKLELGANNLGGSLPHLIGNLSTELTWINFAGNHISGSIPYEICKFINLIYLALDDNNFTGIIPSEIIKLGKLQRVVLSNNRLVGNIPASIGNLSILDEIQLNNNKLEGTIPPSFGKCKMLVLLDLSQNNLNGTIPNKLFNISPFSIMLNLSRNHLVGSLPEDVGNLSNLGGLDVSENELSGVIPLTLGACTSLERLYIQGNFIRGSIPNSLGDLRGIQNVDLSRNNFSGIIPNKLETLQLEYLNLSWNDFEGEVPVKGVFAKASAFSIVGNKRLCGGIPVLQLPICSIVGPKKHKLYRVGVLLIYILSTLLGLTIVSSLFYFRLTRRKKEMSYSRSISMVSNLAFPREKNLTEPSFKVSYVDLHIATNGFSSANLLGSGGFGSVYKGIFDRQYLRSALWYNGMLDRDGTIVAVKVFNHKRKRTFDSFITECEALRNIRHRNLVKIITTCSSVDREGNDCRAILYEFMEYGSLGRWLHSTQEAHFDGLDKPHILNIHARINIAIDVASALSYLHHQCGDPRIHCDIKPSNILLDADMVAHLADFGLAQFLPELPKPDRSSLVRLPGTAGYIPPEYGLGSLVSTEGDVYSYGILLLEMLTGKKPTDRMFHGGLNLHTFAWMALPDRVKDITDPVILRESANGEDGNQMEKCLTKMFTVGVSCSMTSPHVRPNMNGLIRELESVRSIFKSVE